MTREERRQTARPAGQPARPRGSAKTLARAVAAEKRRREAAATLPVKEPATPPGPSTELLALLERLDARGHPVRAALIARRDRLERALERERHRQQLIEAALKPPSQPSAPYQATG